MSSNQPGNKKDTSEYSASKAPDTREHAEERKTQVDDRLQPGGSHGVAGPTGLAAMDRDDVPSRGVKDDTGPEAAKNEPGA